MIPLFSYQAEPLSAALREGWMDWSIWIFYRSVDAVQNPHVDYRPSS